MPPLRDLTEKRFGQLTVLNREPYDPKGGAFWRCWCVCGRETVVSRGNLINGSTKSCGCVRNTQGALTRRHPLWRRWAGLISRCHNSKDKDFANYGQRGITVCLAWHSFQNFLWDMEPTFFAGATIERIDVNGCYSPANCRWATRLQQSHNKRASRIVDTPWGRLNVAEAARRVGIDKTALWRRIQAGWPFETAFSAKRFHRFRTGRRA